MWRRQLTEERCSFVTSTTGVKVELPQLHAHLPRIFIFPAAMSADSSQKILNGVSYFMMSVLISFHKVLLSIQK